MRTVVCMCVTRGAWNAAPLGRLLPWLADGRICAIDSICAFRRVGMSPVCVIALLCVTVALLCGLWRWSLCGFAQPRFCGRVALPPFSGGVRKTPRAPD